MAARVYALTIRASDPDALAIFWSKLLGEGGSPIPLVFTKADLPRSGLNQIHVHLTSNSAAQEDTVARALELGATHLDVGQLPDEDHVVLADPEGNEFCVIEAGNNWLAGTGFLGELAADGTREVGVLWSEATGWPLVHDEDGETAIAPPGGGIKIAWGGPPLNPPHDRNRMHFVLGADDLDAEVDRLVGLGASVVDRRDDEVEAEVERLVGLGASVVERTPDYIEMADPDGNEFHLRAE